MTQTLTLYATPMLGAQKRPFKGLFAINNSIMIKITMRTSTIIPVTFQFKTPTKSGRLHLGCCWNDVLIPFASIFPVFFQGFIFLCSSSRLFFLNINIKALSQSAFTLSKRPTSNCMNPVFTLKQFPHEVRFHSF